MQIGQRRLHEAAIELLMARLVQDHCLDPRRICRPGVPIGETYRDRPAEFSGCDRCLPGNGFTFQEVGHALPILVHKLFLDRNVPSGAWPMPGGRLEIVARRFVVHLSRRGLEELVTAKIFPDEESVDAAEAAADE